MKRLLSVTSLLIFYGLLVTLVISFVNRLVGPGDPLVPLGVIFLILGLSAIYRTLATVQWEVEMLALKLIGKELGEPVKLPHQRADLN